eukprot:1192197-Prorocentrum_minimum.AAC.5
MATSVREAVRQSVDETEGYIQALAVQIAIRTGAEVIPEDAHGETPLHVAADLGNAWLVRLLLRKGASANPTTPVTAVTPLHLAAKEGHTAVVRELLDGGADVDPLFELDGDVGWDDDVEVRWGMAAPLWEATRGGHVEVMKLLLEAGADANR